MPGTELHYLQGRKTRNCISEGKRDIYKAGYLSSVLADCNQRILYISRDTYQCGGHVVHVQRHLSYVIPQQRLVG